VVEHAAARARGLVKAYEERDARVVALDNVDLDIWRGELTAVMGPSGSGKSTLMHCPAGLDAADRGQVWIGDTDITRLGDTAASRLRRDRVGFVFQAFNLLPTLSALENITLPTDLAGRAVDQTYLEHVVAATGLADRLAHRPAELSGGQQQRVAVARALVARPKIVFADEPTGNLDSRARGEILGLLRHAVDGLGASSSRWSRSACCWAARGGPKTRSVRTSCCVKPTNKPGRRSSTCARSRGASIPPASTTAACARSSTPSPNAPPCPCTSTTTSTGNPPRLSRPRPTSWSPRR
jgi:putative ABC transport system ATP-binding protein